MFCVVCNKRNKSVQHQVYVFTATKPRNTRNFIGLNTNKLYIDIADLASNWSCLTDEEKLQMCLSTNHLVISARRYVNSDTTITREESAEIFKYVEVLYANVKSLFEKGVLAEPMPQTAETAETPTSAEPKPQTAETPVGNVTRKTVAMAQMVDNTNLTEFVNGCFYKIVECGKNGYVGLLTDKGEKRLVREGRVIIADVFAEPPKGVSAEPVVCESK